MIMKLILLVGILFILINRSYAQKIVNYTSLNPCYSVAFEKDQMWVGANNATVNVFGLKGNLIKSYTVPYMNTSDGKVYSILIDNDNKWFGTASGFKLFNGIEWKDYSSLGSVDNANSIIKDNNGNIWIATSLGLSEFNGKDWTTPVKGPVRGIAIDKNGKIWCGSNASGIFMFDGKKWSQPSSLVNSVNSIACDKDGRVWFGTSIGLSMFDGTKWTTYEVNTDWAWNNVSSITIDSNNCKWIGTPFGIAKFDGVNWTYYQTKDGLLNSSVQQIYIDLEGNMWASLYNVGLMKLVNGKWIIPSILNNYTYQIAIDRKGNKWFATDSGLSKFDGKNWTGYNASNGLLYNQVWAVAIDNNDNVWVGGSYGVSKLEGENWISYSMRDGLAYDNVNSIIFDKQGNAWIGTGKGLSKFDGSNWTTFEAEFGVYTTAIDKDGIIWTGNNKIAFRFDGTNLVQIASDYIGTIAFDKKGNTWLGTWSNGVLKYDGIQTTRFDLSNGFPGYDGNAIYLDKTDTLWFGSERGISKYDGNRWIDYSQILKTGEVKYITSDSTNILWIGTKANGVYEYYLKRDTLSSLSLTLKNDERTIYPNPTSDFVYFKNISNIKEISISSIEGHMVKHIVNIPTDKINISDLPPGMYIVVIKNDQTSLTRKIMKE